MIKHYEDLSGRKYMVKDGFAYEKNENGYTQIMFQASFASAIARGTVKEIPFVDEEFSQVEMPLYSNQGLPPIPVELDMLHEKVKELEALIQETESDLFEYKDFLSRMIKRIEELS